MELGAFVEEELEEIDVDLELEVDLELDGNVEVEVEVEVDQPELGLVVVVVVDLLDLVVVVGHCSTICHLECISLNDLVKDRGMP